jgi:TonB family protein
MTHLGPSLRRAKIRERPGRRALLAVVASLAINAGIFVLLARAGAFQMGSPGRMARVALTPLSATQWAANRAVGGAQPERPAAAPFAMPRPPPPPPPEPPRDAKGQIVDIAPSKDKTPPKSSRFLAEQDSSVEKETRSRHAKAGYERTLPTPSAPGAQTAPPPGQDGRAARSVPGTEGAPGAKKAADQKVAMAPDVNEGERAGARPRSEGLAPVPAPGTGEGGERRAGAPSENPLIAPGTLARASGGPAPDHLDGIEEGEGTYLNARSFKYATYFNRIKQQVAANWDPLTPLEARDPDRSMFGYKDRFTLLGVTLDDTGHVKSLVVEQTSGVEFLDRAAMTAFRTAQPFMNPPRGIVDERGEIKFSFGFFLEVGRAGLRIYRAPLPGTQ